MYNLEPIYGIVLAFVFFEEGKAVNSGFYVGVGIIMATIILQMWRLIGMKKVG
jgi:hypothetical protein